MTIDQLLVMWVNASVSRAPNGWKGTGIEYRIMREAGLTVEGTARDPDGVGETMVKINDALHIEYGDECKAVYLYAKSGFKVAVVKRHFKCETRKAHQLIATGKDVMFACYTLMKSKSYVNEGVRSII